MMRVVLHFRAGPELRRRLQAIADLEIVVVDETDDRAFSREIAHAAVLLHVLKPVTAEMIAMAPKLRLIQKIGVGINTIDLAAAAARGIRIANMPGTNSQAVAEHTLLLMLAVLRNLVALDAATKSGTGWALPADSTERSGEIANRTIGLVGFGAVPRLLAPILKALGAQVIYYDRVKAVDSIGTYTTLASLVRESDVVSLHMPLTSDTREIVDRQFIRAMKPGAVLINTARGELVNEVELASALSDGHLSGAGLDVFAQEPVDPRNPLLQLANVVTSPHVAWLTMETLNRSMAVAVENVRRLSEGEVLLHEVFA